MRIKFFRTGYRETASVLLILSFIIILCDLNYLNTFER